MGIGPSYKNCHTNYQQPAPNPSPERWEFVDKKEFENGYALKVRYLDCTNFEGLKVMVYRGEYKASPMLDPHFQDNADSPIARFRPDKEGWILALTLASSL